MEKLVSITLAFIIFLGAWGSLILHESEFVIAGNIIYVGSGLGNDTGSIQDAIDNYAIPGDTIFIFSGTYNENILIDETLSLVGEDQGTTIVDGGASGDVIQITANWVNITGFTVTNGEYGVYMDSVSHSSITNNIVKSNTKDGIYATNSPFTKVSQNSISNNDFGVQIRVSSDNCVIEHNMVFNSSRNGIYLSKLMKSSVTGNNVYLNGGNGIYLFTAENTTLSENDFTNNSYGIYSTSSSRNNTIMNNEISINNYGIYFGLSSNNTIYNNYIHNNQNHGIWVHSSSKNNTIQANNISYNTRSGIHLTLPSDYNTIHDNIIFENGVGLNLSSSSRNNITENDIAYNSEFGLYLTGSTNNTIYHNNIRDNSNQAHDDTNDGNYWDDGYPNGGNFWSNWTLPDIMNGVNQDISGSDGIVDNPYVIDADSQDDYPLTNPLDKLPPVITDLTPSDNSYTNNNQPEIAASFYDDSEINVSSVILKLDTLDVASQAIISVDDISYIPITFLSEGQHRVHLEVEDIQGIRATKSWTFYIDSVPPTVSNVQVNGMSSIIIPKGTMVTLSAVIDDSTTSGSVISGANYTVGFQIWPGISMSPSDGSFDSSSENTEITIDTSGWLDGAYNLYIYGWDEHLNYNYSSTAYVIIVIDSTQPYSTINPFSKYWFTSSPISINATANDIESNVESIELWYKFSNDNTSWNSWTLFGIDFESPWNWHFDFPNMDGYYEFYTIALDSSSNYEIKMKADAICGYDTTPPIADAGSKKDAFFRTEFEFDGGNSTDNILIINYTWTFWDAITHTLYGPTPSYTFSFHHRDLLVDLQVTDIAGNRDNDSILINVYDFPKPGRIFGMGNRYKWNTHS